MSSKSRNKFGIAYPSDGPPVLVGTLKQILDALDSLYPQISSDIYPSVGKTGTTFRLRAQGALRGGSAAAATPYPFDVTFGHGSDGSHRAAAIRPGTINGLIPSNYATVPDIVSTGTLYLVLSVTVVDGEITGCTQAFSGSPPAAVPVEMGQPPTSFDFLLGVVVDATWYRVIGLGSLIATGTEVYRISKTSPAPGTLPYDIYYTWSIAAG